MLSLMLGTLSCRPPARRLVASPADFRPGHTVIVGRVEFVPPLAAGEQQIAMGHGRWKDKVLLILGDDVKEDVSLAVDWWRLSGRIEAVIGETFYAEHPSRPFAILGADVFMRIPTHLRDASVARIPIRFEVPVRTDDDAVYIGTLRYHRDEFFRISKLEVLDDFQKESDKFARKFGTSKKLRRALVSEHPR